MIIRQQYLDSLIAYRDKPIIKIIAGMRRCGKSTIIDAFKTYLLADDVLPTTIITMNFELAEFDNINNSHELYDQIKNKLIANKKYYIFLDEIQMVKNWEKTIERLYTEENVDIYLTSSNSLPANLVFGHILINIMPLSFPEYLHFVLWRRQKKELQYNFLRRMPRSFMDQNENLNFDLRRYLEFGGLPTIPFLPQENDIIQGFLEGVYNSIIIKNVLLLNESVDIDIQALKNIVRYVARNAGNIMSPAHISNYLFTHYKNGIYSQDNVVAYILLLERAYIFYEIPCFDIKKNTPLTPLHKYYLSDSGIRNMLLSFSDTYNTQNMGILIYFELIRRGYTVFCGKYDNQDIDFYVTCQNEKKCFQFALTLKDSETVASKLNILKTLPDTYEKNIISMDEYYNTGNDKIKFFNIIDFLLANDTPKQEL